MKIFGICGVVAFLVACSPKSEFKEVQWHAGDDIRELKFMNAIEAPLPSTLQVLNETQEYTYQTFKDIAVEGSFVKKINHQQGQLLSVQAAYLSNPLALKSLPFAEFNDVAEARKKLKKRHPYLSSEDLESLKPLITQKPELVWVVTRFPDSGRPYEYRFSEDFKILQKKPLGIGWFERPAVLYPEGPKLSELKELSMRDLSFSPPLSNKRFSIFTQNPMDFAESDEILKFPTSDARFDQLQVYYYVQRVLDWCQDKLGISLQRPLEVQLHVGYPEKTNAAFYYQGKVRLGEGDDVVYSKIPQDPSIVSHEIFHALIDLVGHLPTEGEGGSLNEAFADFFTAHLLARPRLGENAYLQGEFKRTLENSKKWRDKTGGLYNDSLIVSGLLWELGQALPEDKILKVSLKTLSRMSPLSQFSDFAKELRSALTEYLTPEELNSIQKILKTREVPQ
ncbi:hypothetical protein AZI86_01145 [Bdellovibrio bacteriovorus]|uniref:Uncharacterized protein n=1 Tax=Bdellovibrio bacteriovorus TaxID=959 RepID=A0A150WMM3_BDEBC|nr:hypothetical protein [Bdellovibrio bacteriovorus]KYG65712.1 hypothetical protein AZI86_01145 [Bdellovibrio bacteriovorus]